MIDTLDTKGILTLIESIPSPKAEPFKIWLAQLGNDRIDEVFNPELAVNRAVDYYRSRGYDDKWIEAFLRKHKINIFIDKIFIYRKENDIILKSNSKIILINIWK